MSSFPLTNSIIFQDSYCTTNQMDGFCRVGLIMIHQTGFMSFDDICFW